MSDVKNLFHTDILFSMGLSGLSHVLFGIANPTRLGGIVLMDGGLSWGVSALYGDRLKFKQSFSEDFRAGQFYIGGLCTSIPMAVNGHNLYCHFNRIRTPRPVNVPMALASMLCGGLGQAILTREYFKPHYDYKDGEEKEYFTEESDGSLVYHSTYTVIPKN